jgi:hypothetical protein
VPNSPSDSTGTSVDPRFKIAGVVLVLAVLYVLIQRTSLAPFPHTADDFVGGLAIGLAIGSALAWFRGRR